MIISVARGDYLLANLYKNMHYLISPTNERKGGRDD